MRLFINQLCLLTISSICLAQEASSLRSTPGQQISAQETATKLLPSTKIGIENLPPMSEDGYWIEGAPS
jgi:hypothetical protein